MNRIIRLARTWGVVAVAVAGIATAAAAAPSAKPVQGTVGPGFTIGLKAGGQKVTKLKAGVPYRFVVSDRSSIHNFHLQGPGVDKVFTSVGFTGTKSFTFALKKGRYTFKCDPHASIMHGAFVVA